MLEKRRLCTITITRALLQEFLQATGLIPENGQVREVFHWPENQVVGLVVEDKSYDELEDGSTLPMRHLSTAYREDLAKRAEMWAKRLRMSPRAQELFEASRER